MNEDIAARIRERLDLNGHEDWCPAVIHKRCCDGQCECATGGLLDALRSVLDIPPLDPARGPSSAWLSAGYSAALADVHWVIANALGVPTDAPAVPAGSQPTDMTAGVPTPAVDSVAGVPLSTADQTSGGAR
jgi:hypothetical protein